MDQALDKVHDLESTNKSLAGMSKTIETYKNKAVELEREKFEAVSAAQVAESTAAQLLVEVNPIYISTLSSISNQIL